MLELRLINTKKSIEQELERDDIDGLSTNTSVQLRTATPSVNSLSNSSSESSAQQLERLRRDNEHLKRQLKQEKENTQTLVQNERVFFELKLKEKDEELMEIEKQSAVNKRKYQKLGEEVMNTFHI